MSQNYRQPGIVARQEIPWGDSDTGNAEAVGPSISVKPLKLSTAGGKGAPVLEKSERQTNTGECTGKTNPKSKRGAKFPEFQEPTSRA